MCFPGDRGSTRNAPDRLRLDNVCPAGRIRRHNFRRHPVSTTRVIGAVRLSESDDGKVRPRVLAGVVGANVGAAFMVMADALTPQSDAACAAVAASDGCPSPPLFT